MEVIYSGNRRLIDIESLQLLSQKGSEMNVYNDEELITDLKDYLDILIGGNNMGNFNEEMEKELTELNLGGKVIPILEKDKGTSEDYAKLETKILLRTEQNREMMEQSMINAEHSLSVGEKYSNLTKACHNYPEIQLRTKEKAIKLSKTKFSEQDFITLLLSKLLDNGISKIDTMKLKHILADYYSEEYYACLFEDLPLKEQIEGNYVEFDDALVFAHFAGLLSNPIQGTNMCMIWSSLEDVSSNYSTEYNLKMDELVHNLSSRLNIKNNSINQSKDSREAISKQDEIEKELYEVRVFNEDDRKNNESCKLEQHNALLYIDDVSEKYSNDMENNVYYECICLECGKHKDYKMSLNDRRHIIKTNLSPMETFMSFYEVRKRYLELIKQNCTVEEIIDNLNSFYKKNQEQGPVLIKKKN